MSWKSHIEELRARERLAEQMGGEERVARQRSMGKLTVRERVAFLADPGSFHEVGKIAGKAGYGPDEQIAEFLPATMVFGRATLDGRPAVILGDDFTVRGGASDASIAGKMLMAEQMANEYGMPIVRMIDGTGGGGSVKSLEQNPRTYIPTTPAWEWLVANMARAPVVSLALGPCAGLGAGRVAASHFSVMVKGLSQVFVAGPPVAKAIGEDVDKEGLGGWEINGRNGVVDNVVNSEHEAFAQARRFLSYLPSNVGRAAAGACRARTIRTGGRVPDRYRAEGRQDALHAAQDHRGGLRQGIVLRDRRAVGTAGRDGPCADRRASGGDPRGRSVLPRWRVDGGCVRQGRAAYRSGRHLPPADRALRRLPGICGRREAREGRRHAQGRAGDGGGLSGADADPAGGDPQGLWAGRDPRCSIRRGRGGGIAGRRGIGDRCRWRAESRRLTSGSSKRRRIRRRS